MNADSETNGGAEGTVLTNYDFSQWLGRTEKHEDVATTAPLAGLAATLDHATPPWRAGELPPLAHWLYFLPRTPQHELAEDGHPARGGFLPPVPLPRRMWAGGTIAFEAPIAIGERIQRISTVADIQHKTGRSGNLVFVKVVHEILASGGMAVREEQDIVYREANGQGTATAMREMRRENERESKREEGGETAGSAEARASTRPAHVNVPPAEFTRTIVPDSVMLFRFSALTFNGHRIHYDRDYCREREGYPGLVVHGPLTATLLMDIHLRHHSGARVKAFRFRGQRPAFDGEPLALSGASRADGTSLWATNDAGDVVMTAELEAG